MNGPRKVLLRRKDVLELGFTDEAILKLVKHDLLHPVIFRAGKRYYLFSEIRKLVTTEDLT